MTCKDCIHCVTCKYVDRTDKYCWATDCKDFKNKSKFIELPCNLYDEFYVLEYQLIKGRYVPYIEEKQVYAFGIWEYIEGEGDATLVIYDRDKTEYFVKNIFLTKEEAEKALKEYRRKNEKNKN